MFQFLCFSFVYLPSASCPPRHMCLMLYTGLNVCLLLYTGLCISVSTSLPSVRCPLCLCAREELVELLVGLVEACPSVCQTDHIPAILGAYGASRSRAGGHGWGWG